MNVERKGLRLPRSLRIPRRAEFRAVFDHGRSSSDGRLVIYVRPRPEGGPTRLGLVVGRKFGPAHRRNLWKRRVREAFRTTHASLPESHDLVVLPARPEAEAPVDTVRESLRAVSAAAARAFARRGPR